MMPRRLHANPSVGIDAKTAFDSANRWTDNIFELKSYCTKTLMIPSDTFNQHFDVDENFDYIELPKKA